MSTHAPIDPRQLRRALGTFATGVTIVTTHAAGRDVGLTANSFNSVSLNPPMVLWSLARNSLGLAAFMESTHFAVHVLASAQETLSARFGARGGEKFAGLVTSRGAGNVPLLPDCTARFQCRTVYRYEGGDHVIFVGEVLAFDQSDLPPLLFHDGRYAIARPKPTASAAESSSGFTDDFLIYLLSRTHHQLFLQLRLELAQHGLAEADWFCLSILSAEGSLSIAELGERLAHTGIQVTFDRLASLGASDLLRLHGGHDPGTRVTLTDPGRRAVVELVAAAKAAEDAALAHLEPDQARQLKQWLRSFVLPNRPLPWPSSADD
jgi:3-hydroxy-9,10-secoandrosta-1,3,5(10)-triene-9,17-dione monooxygenase reductase component